MNKPATESPVIIYGAEWCGFCHQAKAYFEQKDVPYVYHDIEKEEDAYRELAKKLDGNIAGVPVIDVYGEIIVGYDLRKINAALEAKAA